MALKETLTGESGRRWLDRVNLGVYTLVGIAIIVVANVLVGKYVTTRWDLTPTKKFSLAPQTTKILQGLKQDVTIYSFDRGGGSRDRQDLLKLFSSASRRVTVRFVDPDREPSLAKQYGVRTYGTIVVAAGDRHFEAEGGDEEAIANALIRLLKGQKAIYAVSGHGERDLDSSDRSGYSGLKKEIENESYDVKPLVLLQKMEVPADCSLLVIAGPRTDYLPQEVDVLRKYIEGGGRLLAMLDPGENLPNLSKLFADWNINVRNDLVVDMNPLAQIFGTQPTMPLIVKYGSSPIVQPLARTATLFPMTRSFEIGKDYKSGVTTDSLCETSPESFGVADFNPNVHTVSYHPGKDYKGPLTVAVAGTVTNSSPAPAAAPGQKKPEGRFVALGSSSIATNVYLGFQGNRDLLMNAVNWLTAEEDLISIRPRPQENQHLDLTAKQMRQILILGVFGLPLLIIAAGVSVWWSRR